MMQALRTRPVLAPRLLQIHRFASTRPTLAPLPTGEDALPPQHAPPAPWQRGAQALGFVLAGGMSSVAAYAVARTDFNVACIVAGVYGVLFYEFEQENHCFQPIRQQFASIKQQFMTLPEDARTAPPKREAVSRTDSQKRLV
ncbi:hypothetical protein P389DRAFT_110268 [Cystobasidium minutum MCA 4210]|uniref:uncharacterized protein n=1 Tax=Cystobasidium minutum MCA 4210 TaxID=1397322 RepID=UPI0034CD4E62|eukprot:jgi/Rhomi1/110268/CE110267_155